MQIRNWATIKSADLLFPEKGLVLVLGSNLAAEGKLKSVGAGKTTTGEALSRTLLGVTGRAANFAHYCNDEINKDMYVRLEADLKGKPLLVESGFKCNELSKTGEGFKFTYDGQEISRAHVDQTREELAKAIQVTPELAEWTVFLDGDKLKINRMSQENSVNLLMSALAQPPWTDYFEKAKKVMSRFQQDVATQESEMETAKENIRELESELQSAEEELSDAKENYQQALIENKRKIDELKANIDLTDKKIQHLETEIATRKKQLKKLEEAKAGIAAEIDQKKNVVRQELALAQKQHSDAIEDRSTACRKKEDAKETLTEMKSVPKNCPKCHKPWDKAHSASELKKAESDLDNAIRNLESAKVEVNRLIVVCSNKNGAIDVLDKELRAAAKLDEQDEIADKQEEHEESLKQLTAANSKRAIEIVQLEKGVSQSKIDGKTAIVEERKRAIAKAKSQVTELATAIVESQELKKILDYWYKAFGPTGIPNMILTDAIRPLNLCAQRISNMSGGTLKVTYATTRNLAKGDSRAELTIKVKNVIGSKRLDMNSKGESGLINLIIAETLAEVGGVSSRVGFRWFDEITSGQDELVRRSIFAYLKELANRVGILIFVVDHHSEACSFADHILIAEKSRDHGTSLKWQAV